MFNRRLYDLACVGNILSLGKYQCLCFKLYTLEWRHLYDKCESKRNSTVHDVINRLFNLNCEIKNLYNLGLSIPFGITLTNYIGYKL